MFYSSTFCREQAGRPKCPVDPFFIVPDKCKCVDFQVCVWLSARQLWAARIAVSCLCHIGLLQVLKLQESPDAVPKGEMPRHMQLYCDRYLTDRVVPGNRITVIGIYSIRKTGIKPAKV